MNLDASATILNAVRRGAGLNVDHEDLMVTQGDYQSSCATVLLLDCPATAWCSTARTGSTPAKRVALALTNLIKRQYPGDALRGALSRFSGRGALAHLGRVPVGPYYATPARA